MRHLLRDLEPPHTAWQPSHEPARFPARIERRERALQARAALSRLASDRPLEDAPTTSGARARRRRSRGLRLPVGRLALHGCVGAFVLLVALGDLFGGWSGRARVAQVQPQIAPAEQALVGLVPAGSLAMRLSAVQISPVVHTPLAPALRSPVELTDAFRTVHILGPDETLGAVAARYNLSLEALIWANGLERGDALALGQLLRIPQVAGVPYTVRAGETAEEIAGQHGVPVEAILSFGPNRLDGPDELIPGQQIFIPGGTRPLPEALLNSYGGLEGLALRVATPAGVVRAEQTNLREGPGTDYARVLQLEAGRQVELRARHDDWLKVAIAGAEAWVRSDLLDADSEVVAGLPLTNDFPPPPPRWVWPTYGTLTSGFGARWGTIHNGIDIANRAWTPIRAASGGVVREAGWCRGYGYCVKIRHPGGIETIYGHLIEQPVVSAGEEVSAGQLIGYMGSTFDRAGGGYSTGVHLHFTISVNGKAVDPLRFLP